MAPEIYKKDKIGNFCMMKVDKEKCIGCGACVSLCPEVFELKDGKSVVKGDGDCDEAVDACPVGAIAKA